MRCSGPGSLRQHPSTIRFDSKPRWLRAGRSAQGLPRFWWRPVARTQPRNCSPSHCMHPETSAVYACWARDCRHDRALGTLHLPARPDSVRRLSAGSHTSPRKFAEEAGFQGCAEENHATHRANVATVTPRRIGTSTALSERMSSSTNDRQRQPRGRDGSRSDMLFT